MNSIIEYKLARETKELSECSFQPNLCSGSGSTRSASRRFKQFYEDQLRLWENSKIIKANLKLKVHQERSRAEDQFKIEASERKRLYIKLQPDY
jgi:hypothetical protein